MTRLFRIGTRKSALALAQANLVAIQIENFISDSETKIVGCVTSGDVNLSKSLADFGGKGAFIREIEELLVRGDIDVAVHSGKDLPSDLDPRTELLVTLPREDPRDVLLTRADFIGNMKILGTSSPRRMMFAKNIFPEIECSLLRGNVPTRIDKLKNHEYDGIVLAVAGLKRLNLENDELLCYRVFDPTEFVPAGCQGIIALQVLKDSPTSQLLHTLINHKAHQMLVLEREILKLLGVGCHDAIGVYSWFEEEKMQALICTQKNNQIVTVKGNVSSCNFATDAQTLCNKLNELEDKK